MLLVEDSEQPKFVSGSVCKAVQLKLLSWPLPQFGCGWPDCTEVYSSAC
jgi:hypothetical protein